MSKKPDYSHCKKAIHRLAYNLEQIAEKYSNKPESLTEWDLDTDQILLTDAGKKAPVNEIKRELKRSMFASADDFGFATISTPCVDPLMSKERQQRVLKQNNRFNRRFERGDLNQTSFGEEEDLDETIDADEMLNRQNDEDFEIEREDVVNLEELFSASEIEMYQTRENSLLDELMESPSTSTDVPCSSKVEQKKTPEPKTPSTFASKLRPRKNICYSENKRSKRK